MSAEIPKDPIRRRRRWQGPLAAGVMTVVGVPALAGCFAGTGGSPSQPDACGPLATTISQLHINRAGEPPCFDPEAAKEKHKTIPIDAHSTIFNFTNYKIDIDAVKNTIAFFNAMADSTQPVFLNQKGDIFTETIGDKKIQGEMTERYITPSPYPYARAYFILPNKDNTYVSVFAENATANSEYPISPGDAAYTIQSQIGKKQISTSVSYVYEPGPDDDPHDTLLSRFNTELCQSAIEGFAVNGPPDNYDSDSSSIQEGLANTLAHALTAVQRGMSRDDFISNYVTSAGLLDGPGAPASLIPLNPRIYDLMKKVQPAITA